MAPAPGVTGLAPASVDAGFGNEAPGMADLVTDGNGAGVLITLVLDLAPSSGAGGVSVFTPPPPIGGIPGLGRPAGGIGGLGAEVESTEDGTEGAAALGGCIAGAGPADAAGEGVEIAGMEGLGAANGAGAGGLGRLAASETVGAVILDGAGGVGSAALGDGTVNETPGTGGAGALGGAVNGTVVAAGSFSCARGGTAEVGGLAGFSSGTAPNCICVTGAGGTLPAGGAIGSELCARGAAFGTLGKFVACGIFGGVAGAAGATVEGDGGTMGFGSGAVGASVAAVAGMLPAPIGRVTDSIIRFVGGLRPGAEGVTLGIAAIAWGFPPGLGGKLIRIVSFFNLRWVVLSEGAPPPAARLMVLLGTCMPWGITGFCGAVVLAGGAMGNLAPSGKFGFGGGGGVKAIRYNKTNYHLSVNLFFTFYYKNM